MFGRVVCGLWLGTLLAQPAFGQAPPDVAIVSVSYGRQVDSGGLSEAITIEKHAESAPVRATMDQKGMPFFDIGMTLKITGNLGASVALSYLSSTGTADVTAEIPHPFHVNRRRPIGGEADGVRRREVVLHTNVAYVIASPAVTLVVSGGPSFFRVQQDFVTDVTFDESYPFDTATFARATLARASASKTGYNLAADVMWKLGESWGLGGIVRFSRASIPFTAAGIDFGTADVGGLQAGGGLRLFF